MYYQFRVDDHNVDKASELLKRYADKHNGKFLLSKEVGSQTGKPHLQGFCFSTAEPPAYKQFFSRAYSEHGTHGKCFTPVKKLDVYIAYLLNNDSKTKPKYKDLITNYTEEEYEEITKDITPFVVKTTYKKSYYDEVLEALEKECVKDGIIQYSLIPQVYMRFAPKRVSSKILYELVTGYTVRLEYKFPTNKRVRQQLYNDVCRLDDENGFFKNDSFSYLKFDE